ncbi:MAG: hypothetical protein P8170_12295 [Gemmatimonadota bacterium]
MSHETGHPPLLRGGDPEAPPLSHRARMKDSDEPPGMWDKTENTRRLFRVLYAACAILVILDLVVHRHAEHPWEHVVEFYPLYGFLGIVILVIAAKGLRRLAMRPEDYYDAG